MQNSGFLPNYNNFYNADGPVFTTDIGTATISPRNSYAAPSVGSILANANISTVSTVASTQTDPLAGKPNVSGSTTDPLAGKPNTSVTPLATSGAKPNYKFIGFALLALAIGGIAYKVLH